MRRLEESQRTPSCVPRFLAKIALFLKMRGVKREGTESLAEALARALEISSRELRALLTAGIDPIHKYLSEHGILAEIQATRAARRVAGGSRVEAV
jgi:hydrogenase maturation factor HypE